MNPPSAVRSAAVARPAALAAVALFAIIGFAPSELTAHFTVFVLAIVIGYYVIGNVHHALHTPLMSVTNAISSVIIVGAILAVGVPLIEKGTGIARFFGFIGIVLASVNIFGGFLVTQRMLGMYKKKG